MIILHPFISDPARELDQVETWQCLERVRRKYAVIDRDCSNDDFAYSKFIAEYWAKGHDILIVEQDIVFDLRHAVALECCDKGVCAYEYQYGPSTRAGLGFTRFKSIGQTNEKKWITAHWVGLEWGLINSATKKSGNIHVHKDEVLRHNFGLTLRRQARA